MFKTKKGQADINGIVSLVIGMAIVGIVLAIFIYMISTLSTTLQTTNLAAGQNVSNVSVGLGQVVAALITIPAWLPIIVVATIGAIVLGIVVAAFMYFRGREE
jgi:uncharacterized membrane protein YjgN (DUF898 family)